MTVSVTLTNDALHVDIRGWARILALKGSIQIPLAHIAGIRLAGADAHDWRSGFKMSGARIPGLIKAGTFRGHQTSDFWYVRHPEQAVLIELRDEKFARLMIEVDQPDALIAQVRQAIS